MVFGITHETILIRLDQVHTYLFIIPRYKAFDNFWFSSCLNSRMVFYLQILIAFSYLQYLKYPARCTNRNYDAANFRLLSFS